MKTYVWLSFGFLGLAFYEASGGAKFEPPERVIAQTDQTQVTPVEIQQADEEPVNISVRIEPARYTVDSARPSNARAQDRVDLSKIDSIALPENTTTNPMAETAETAEATVTFGVPRNVISEDSAAQAIIPSLIAPAEEAITLTAEDTPQKRMVSGNRVNVRGGPGTGFDVVAGLVKGDLVEVIEDNGNWVRLRLPGDDAEGWVAAFLLTDI